MAQTLQEKARKFAVKAHGIQKYGEQPYSIHLDDVAELARPFGPLYEAVAYLHDVLEDTSVEGHELLWTFGSEVSSAVFFLTDPEAPSRAERKAKLHKRLAGLQGKHSWHNIVLVVKACDRLANLRECAKNGSERHLKMYVEEHEEFRKAVYRPDLCDEIWSEIDNLVESQQ